MVLDEIVHNYVASVDMGGGGKYGKVSVIGASTNNPKPTADKELMDMLSMVVSMVGMTCSGVVGPYGSPHQSIGQLS